MQHRAIETRYKGYRFRSRLEARWAVFFDSLGIKWQYEPEGFEKEEPMNREEDRPIERVVRYLPDFYLPEFGTWVEIKGQWTVEKADELTFMLDFGSPLWHFTDSGYKWDFDKRKEHGLDKDDCRGLLLLGQIPDVYWGNVMFPIVRHRKGLVLQFAKFTGAGYVSFVDDSAVNIAAAVAGYVMPNMGDNHLDYYASLDKEKVEFFSAGPIIYEAKFANKKLMDAFAKARMARFEHGETP